MGEAFTYEHNAKIAAKKKRVMELDESVEGCLKVNGVAVAVFEVAIWLLVAEWHEWLRLEPSLSISLLVTGGVALIVSLVVAVRLILRILKGCLRDLREVNWVNVIITLGLSVIAWITPWVVLEVL